jgi:hypothetical protein
VYSVSHGTTVISHGIRPGLSAGNADKAAARYPRVPKGEFSVTACLY